MQDINRETERKFLYIYSILTLFLILASHMADKPAIVIIPTIAVFVVCWFLYLKQIATHKVRAIIMSVLLCLGLVLYGISTSSYYSILLPFAMSVLVIGLFNIPELILLTSAVILFLTGYHILILRSIDLLSQDNLFWNITQLIAIIGVEYISYQSILKNIGVNERLLEMIGELREAERSKDEFMANVSHEIRTPLNTINGMSELILREELTKQVREQIFHVQTAGRTLQALVSDVLDFTELQTGNLSLNEEYYNFSSVMNDILNMAIAENAEKNLDLIVDCDAQIPCSMVGDSEKISRVMNNILNNAIKFTDKGCIQIIVRTRREEYGANLSVTVKDTGIGMEPELIERLFTNFNQQDTKKNRRQGGIGLGLAISRKMVDLMNGFLKVESEVGKGSEVSFVVPQKVQDEQPMIQVQDKDNIRIAVYINLEKYSMAEIRDSYVKMIGNMVKQLGLRITQCRTLADLKMKMEKPRYTHLFITDDEYREDPEWFAARSKELKIIMVLNRGNEEGIIGDYCMIYKPFYVLSVAAALNGENLIQRMDGSHYLTNHFVAPKARVLVVDDNIMNLRVMEGLLRPYEVLLFTATGGEEALKMLNLARYDLIFMDHMMPHMDGVETFHRIRGKGGRYYETVPIVALTANAVGGAREMFLAEGFDDFVAKPVSVSSLERVLKRYLPGDMIEVREDELLARNVIEEPVDNAKEADDKESVFADQGAEKGYKINMDTGLVYCGGEMEDFLEIVQIYYQNGLKKRQEMERLFEERDWEEYTIQAHSLKSTSLSIGAEEMSALAKAQEAAGKAGDEAELLRAHEPLMQEYERTLEEVRERWCEND